jgi:hypothetical protein
MGVQTKLQLDPEGERPPTPQVYVASSLTHLDRAGIRLVRDECDIICQAVTEATREAEDQWEARVHVPVVWSAPSTSDTRSPREIYRINSDIVFCHCDALIVHGFHGGSMGAGQEFAWADQLGIPVLYLHHQGEPVSRQLAGTPAFLELVEFDGPVELREAVKDFVRRWRPAISDGPRRRKSLRLRYEVLRTALREAWQVSSINRREVASLSRLTEDRIEELLNAPERLALVPLDRFIGLVTALGLQPSEVLGATPLPDLEAHQLRALFAAEAENSWAEEVTRELLTFARLELAKGGIRRFPLSSIDDWVTLHEIWKRGRRS